MACTTAPKLSQTIIEVSSNKGEPRLRGPLRGLNPHKNMLPPAVMPATCHTREQTRSIRCQLRHEISSNVSTRDHLPSNTLLSIFISQSPIIRSDRLPFVALPFQTRVPILQERSPTSRPLPPRADTFRSLTPAKDPQRILFSAASFSDHDIPAE